jgi:DNA repair protein RadA/Sms
MKLKSVFVCQSCGSQSARWVGKCPNCEEWNSYVEETSVTRVDSGKMRVADRSGSRPAPLFF